MGRIESWLQDRTSCQSKQLPPWEPWPFRSPPPPTQICLSAEQKSRNCLRDPRMRFLAQMKSSAVAARRELTPGRELEGYS